MGLLLLLLGLAATAGGVAAFGYGMLHTEFRGLDANGATVAVMGGLVLIALAAVISPLRRIADALEAQSFHESPAAVVAPRAPAVTSMGAAAVAAALSDPIGEQPSVRATPAPAGEPPPRAPEPKLDRPPPRDAADLPPPPSMTGAPAPGPVGPEPPSARGKPADWPTVEPADRIQTAPASDNPNGPHPARETTLEAGRTASATAEIGTPAAEPSASGPQVLKSGVIEGMAYTLYSDGSVDAELPEGTRHFASIAEWRAYLRQDA
jgi:hypothetical protein